MLRRSLPLLLALATAASTGEPALRMLIPDVQRFHARLAAGPLADMLQHPAMVAWLAQHAGPGGQLLRSTLAGSSQLRAQIDEPGRIGGYPSARLTVAAVATGETPVIDGLPALRVQRSGAWHMVGWPQEAVRRPEPLSLPDLLGGEDVLLRTECPAWAGLLPPGPSSAAVRLAAAWNLGQARLHIDLAACRGRLTFPAARLPLRPIDPQALAGMPADAALVIVVGVSGSGWAAVAEDLCWLLDYDPHGLGVEASLGAALPAVLAACDGTIWLALNGPDGDWQLSLPAHPTLIAAVRHGLGVVQPEPGPEAEATVERLMAQARDLAITVATQGRSFSVRLAHGRLWIASDVRLLDRLQADELTVPVTSGWVDQVCFRMQWNAYQATILGGHDSDPSAWRGLLRAAATAGVPAGHLEAHAGQDGLQVTGEQGLCLAAGMVAALPTLASDWLTTYADAVAGVRQAGMRQVLDRARGFAKATSWHWPRDLADLRARAADLGDDLFACAGRPDLSRPFIYVQPMVGAPDDQPVLVQDPAVNEGRGGLVGFVDGRVEYRAGPLYWSEANRLVLLSSTLEQGAAPSDWATMPKVF